MTEISLIEVYKIIDSFFKYFEGNFFSRTFCKKLLWKALIQEISFNKRYNGIEYLQIFHAVLKLKGISPIRKRIFERTISQFSEL